MFQVTERGSTYFSGEVVGSESEQLTISIGGSKRSVSVGDVVTYTGLRPSSEYTVQLYRPKKYVYLKISRGGSDPLSLGEVEVYDSSGINIARFGQAFQSSTSYDGVASRAINGDISGNWYKDGVTHTTTGRMPQWWSLEFAEPTTVSEIRVYNRTDCCGSRLEGALMVLQDEFKNSVTKVLTSKSYQRFVI